MDGSEGTAPRTGAVSAPETLIRVLICHDCEVLRQGLRTVLRSSDDLVVVAEASDAAEALRLATATRPDVALVGLEGQGTVVHDLVRGLSAQGVQVVLLGEADPSSDLVDALRAGARGYVHTTVSPQRLVEGMRSAAHGETVLDAAVTGELLHRLGLPGTQRRLLQPLGVATQVGEGQWIGDAGREAGLGEAARVGDQIDARPRTEPEVVVAFRADLQVAVQPLAVEQPPAVGAGGPARPVGRGGLRNGGRRRCHDRFFSERVRERWLSGTTSSGRSGGPSRPAVSASRGRRPR
jgi:DNA-binding NarL/FixJ family response regulator